LEQRNLENMREVEKKDIAKKEAPKENKKVSYEDQKKGKSLQNKLSKIESQIQQLENTVEKMSNDIKTLNESIISLRSSLKEKTSRNKTELLEKIIELLEKQITKIGNNCLLMVGVHVAHDCLVGNHVILANNATLAGHVQVGDNVVIGGLSAVHQFGRIGSGAMIGGMSGVESDVIPFGLVMGERAHLAGLNLVGMKRQNISRDEIHALRNFYKQVFESGIEDNFHNRANKISQDYSQNSSIKEVMNFVNSETSRSFCQPKNLNHDHHA
jgi:acetyltransferase-like isoleucine patch superfamily enzyme